MRYIFIRVGILFFLLYSSCVEYHWSTPINTTKSSCNPENYTEITHNSTWKATWGSQKQTAKGCLLLYWGSTQTTRRSIVIKLDRNGKLFGYNTEQKKYNTSPLLLTSEKPTESKRFRVFIFGEKWQQATQEKQRELCSQTMHAPDYQCLARSSSECWFYLDFFPQAENTDGSQSAKNVQESCKLFIRKASTTEYTESTRETFVEQGESFDGGQYDTSSAEHFEPQPEEKTVESNQESPPEQGAEIEYQVEETEFMPESNMPEQPPIPTCQNSYCVTTIAGTSQQNFVGPKEKTWFDIPRYGVFDTKDNLYISDSGAHVIKKISLKTGKTSIFAGSDGQGAQNGPKDKAKFYNPMGLAINTKAELFIADNSNAKIRKIIMSSGFVYDQTNQISYPTSVALGPKGNLYIIQNHKSSIWKITTTGAVSRFAGTGQSGYKEGARLSAQFSNPKDLVVDKMGNIYVADTQNHRIRKIDLQGQVSTFAGSGISGYKNGLGNNAQFSSPRGIAIDSQGDIFVADSGTRRVRKIDSKGQVTLFAGNGSQEIGKGNRLQTGFLSADSIFIDKKDDIYIISTFAGSIIQKINRSTNTVTLFAGEPKAALVDGSGKLARFNGPSGLALDAKGALYIADTANNCIRRIDNNGNVTTYAGTGKNGCKNGTRLQAQFSSPKSLAFDKAGNLLIANTNCHTIQKIDASGNVTTLAGSRGAGAKDGPAAVASFRYPYDLTIHPNGDIYVSDTFNYKIRKITPAGIVSTFAGTGQRGLKNTTRLSATFNQPKGLAFDKLGNLFVVDGRNHTIRKIDTSGKVTTFAGSGRKGWKDGSHSIAQFSDPNDIAFTSKGELLVIDSGNHRIRKVTSNGDVSTIVGSGVRGHKDGNGQNVHLSFPEGIAIGKHGHIYISDNQGHRIRKIVP